MLQYFQYIWFVLFFIIDPSITIEHDFKGFDDTIIFGINWSGAQKSLENLIDETTTGDLRTLQDEILKVTTSNKESYECSIPDLQVNKPTDIEDYTGPSPLALLKPIFGQKVCSYRLESYWSYEVCHGRYIRQYHEEREGKQIKSQQYFLGIWDTEKQRKLEEQMLLSNIHKEKLRYTKIDGMTLPYIELVMGDGSLCDLSGKPRMTRVQYVCYNHGKHEVYSFKETLTCEYEIIILSPLLCAHPQFKPQETTENYINCNPVEDAPQKPRSLLAHEVESMKNQHQSVRLTNNDKDQAKDVLAVLKVEKIEKDGETHLKFELRPINEAEQTDASSQLNQLPEKSQVKVKPSYPVLSDDSPVRAFLNGKNCLTGGSGWWKYEFCYGKHVKQYHVDRSGNLNAVLLGLFDEKAHIEWIKENLSKAPKPAEHRTSISHFYANGDICDKSGVPRQTEVKLKCLENTSKSAQVSLYLLEPKTCHYILGVESPLICDILPLADQHGLVTSFQFNEKGMTTDKSGYEGDKEKEKL